jgi:hypothetical protein
MNTIPATRFVSRRLPRLLVGAAVVALAVAAPRMARAETITIISGGGPIGTLDPVNEFTLDGGATYQPAHIISPHPFYSIIPGTNYINKNPDYTGEEFANTHYRTTFQLCAGFSNASLIVNVHADNVATVFLNGVQFGQQPFAEIGENYQDPPSSFTATGPFLAGTNTLEFDIFNFSGPTAFDYKAVVSFSCPGSTCPVVTALSPAKVWIGLKNSDDVGTKFDLQTELFKNGTLFSTNELDNIPGGSSGFNNAVLRSIDQSLFGAVVFCTGDVLSIRLSVRAATNGHRSGTARLWFNDAAANSNFDATVNGGTAIYHLLDGFLLGTSPGPGPKKTIDVFVDRLVNGNAFKPFGTWNFTF